MPHLQSRLHLSGEQVKCWLVPRWQTAGDWRWPADASYCWVHTAFRPGSNTNKRDKGMAGSWQSELKKATEWNRLSFHPYRCVIDELMQLFFFFLSILVNNNAYVALLFLHKFKLCKTADLSLAQVCLTSRGSSEVNPDNDRARKLKLVNLVLSCSISSAQYTIL